MNNDQQILGMLTQKIGSANWTQWQIQRWQWYDYVRLAYTAASTTTLNFFTIPQGGVDPNSALAKTLEDTNMVKASTFGQQYFIIQQVRTHLQAAPKKRQNATVQAYTTHSLDQLVFTQAYKNAMQRGVMNITIGQKLYFDINQPWRAMPPGFGLTNIVVPFDRTASSTGNAFIQQSNNMDDIYSLTPPQLVEPEQTFQIQISFPDTNGYNFHNTFDASGQDAYVNAGVILDGYLARPVQ